MWCHNTEGDLNLHNPENLKSLLFNTTVFTVINSEEITSTVHSIVQCVPMMKLYLSSKLLFYV